MATRVSVIDANGQRRVYSYDRGHNKALGTGKTSIVYSATRENAPQQRAAVKVLLVDTVQEAENLRREAMLVERLRAGEQPGYRALPWMDVGQDIGSGTICLVMEEVGDEYLLSSHLEALGSEPIDPGVQQGRRPTLKKEWEATRAGLQYADLLVRMSQTRIVTQGDRKQADFRWLPNEERLVVLDWNRARLLEDGDAETLRRGQLNDIAIFGRLWTEMLTGKALRSAEAPSDDPTWQALSLGMRDILTQSLAAGTRRGYTSADALQAALSDHAERLSKSEFMLLADMGQLERANPPNLAAELRRLIDLAERRGTPDDHLRRYRDLAEGARSAANSSAANAITTIRSYVNRRNWDVALTEAERALRATGGLTPDTVGPYLNLLRWKLVTTVGPTAAKASSHNVAGWASSVRDVLADLEKPVVAAPDIADAGEKLVSADTLVPAVADDLMPLRMELEARRASLDNNRATAEASWKKLEARNPDYANALRQALPALDDLISGVAAPNRAATARQPDRGKAADALFARFEGDLRERRLPPADWPAAQDLARAYRPLWAAYDEADDVELNPARRAEAQEAISSLAGLYDALRRRHFDEAIAGILNVPAALGKTRYGLQQQLNQLPAHLMDQMEEAARGEPLWPDELERMIEAADRLVAEKPTWMLAQRADTLYQALTARREQQRSLQERLGAPGFLEANDWPGFLAHVSRAAHIDADGTDVIDEALREAVRGGVEVWSPTPPLEVAFFDGDVARAYEGYRARTLLALRTANLLPGRLRQLSDDLQQQVAALETNQPQWERVHERFLRGDPFDGELNALEQRLGRYNKVVDALLSKAIGLEERVAGLAQRQQAIETALHSRLTALNKTQAEQQELSLLQDTLAVAPAALPGLAGLWLTRSLDSAADLRLEEAGDHLATARDLLGDGEGGLKKTADALDAALQQMSQWQQAGTAPGSVWNGLETAASALAQGKREAAERALRDIATWEPAAKGNSVWIELSRRVASLADEAPAPAPLPEPVRDTQPTIARGTPGFERDADDMPLGGKPSDRTNENQVPVGYPTINQLLSKWQGFIQYPERIKEKAKEFDEVANATERFLNSTSSPGEVQKLDQRLKQVWALVDQREDVEDQALALESLMDQIMKLNSRNN